MNELPPPLAPAPYAALLARYHPVEVRTKRWILALPASTNHRLRIQAYHAFCELARITWPTWPSVAQLRVLPATDDLAAFEAALIPTIMWTEWAEHTVLSGLLALTWLCTDLHAAGRHRAPSSRPHRAPLWRPDVWPWPTPRPTVAAATDAPEAR
jgi:hypothetical protein